MDYGLMMDMEEAMDIDLVTLYAVPDVESPLMTNGRVMLMESGNARRTSISDTSVVFVDDNAPPAQDYYINTEQHTFNNTSSFTFQHDKINATYYNGFELGGGGVVGGGQSDSDDADIVREFLDLDTPLVESACAQSEQSESTLLYGDENCFGSLRRGDSWLENSCTLLPADSDANAVGNIVEEIRTAAAEIEQQRNSPAISPNTSYTWSSEDDGASLDSIDVDSLINMQDYHVSESDGDSDYEPARAKSVKASPHKRRSGSKVEDRRERKKAQNRAAAIRYRQKKMSEKEDKQELLIMLSNRNRELKRIVKNVTFEVDFMKRLIAEKKQASFSF